MVAEAIREARARAGMTRQAVADATGLSVDSVRDIEWPRTGIDVRHLCALAKALDTTIEALTKQVDEKLIAPARGLVNYGPDGQPIGVTNVAESDAHHAGLGSHVLNELAAREDSDK